MARRSSNKLDPAWVDQLVNDFREEIEGSAAELIEGMLHAKNKQSSVTVTVSLRRKPASKNRAERVYGAMATRVRAPRKPRFYDVNFEQGALAFEGVAKEVPEGDLIEAEEEEREEE